MSLNILLQEGGGLMSMLPFVAMFAVIYLFMIRPQMKRQKNEKKFQSEISKGSKVITSS
jgi:preprotein translocase subunit YajC